VSACVRPSISKELMTTEPFWLSGIEASRRIGCANPDLIVVCNPFKEQSANRPKKRLIKARDDPGSANRQTKKEV
jgi:hypothetical protein